MSLAFVRDTASEQGLPKSPGRNIAVGKSPILWTQIIIILELYLNCEKFLAITWIRSGIENVDAAPKSAKFWSEMSLKAQLVMEVV